MIEITILNWNKYNPKRAQKTYTWLRLDNQIPTDPDLYGLDAEQKFVWIAILCHASRKNSKTVKIKIDYLSHMTTVDKKKVLMAVFFLQENHIIECSPTLALPHATPGCSERLRLTTPTNERTNERDERDERSSSDTGPSVPAPTERKSSKENDPHDQFVDMLIHFWNDQGIIRHKVCNKLRKDVRAVLRPRIQSFSEDEVVTAIKNYKDALNGSFTYKWTLVDFLKRDTATKFFGENFCAENWTGKSNSTKSIQNNLENNPYLSKEPGS